MREAIKNYISSTYTSDVLSFVYSTGRYIDDDGNSYSQASLGGGNDFYKYATKVASVLKGHEFTDSGYRCYIKECTGDGGTFINPKALTCSVYVK